MKRFVLLLLLLLASVCSAQVETGGLVIPGDSAVQVGRKTYEFVLPATPVANYVWEDYVQGGVGEVAAWPSRYGSAPVLSQSVEVSKPTKKSDHVLFPGRVFDDASGGSPTGDIGVEGKKTATVFTVIAPNTLNVFDSLGTVFYESAGGYTGFCPTRGRSTTEYLLAVFIRTTSTGTYYESSPEKTGGTLVAFKKMLVSVTIDLNSTSNNVVFYVNGTSLGSSSLNASGGAFAANSAFVNLGGFSNTTSYDFNGKFYETIIYDRVLSAEEISYVNAGLMRKYGVVP